MTTHAATATTTLTAPAAIDPQAVIINETCSSAGSIDLSPTGGTGSYTYLWSTGLTTSTIDVDAGTYSVTITDGNGCKADFTYTVGGFVPMTVLVESKLEKCFEGDIELTAIASGGTLPYTYSWSSGETTSTIQADAGTTYTVTATDNNGCTGATKITVPTQLQSYLCCLADKMYAYALKLKNGLKTCKCERIKNLVLSILIDVYEYIVTPVNGIIAEQLINDSSELFGQLTLTESVAQSFISTSDVISSVNIIPSASVGTPSGDVQVALFFDSSGSPGSRITDLTTIPNALWESRVGDKLTIPFTGFTTPIYVGTKYWIRIIYTGFDDSNYPTISTSGTANYGVFKELPVGGTWSSPINDSLYFILWGDIIPDCLTDDQKQNIKGLITERCGCCGCDDLPQKSI